MRFEDLERAVKTRAPRSLVVIGAHEENVLRGVARAAAEGIARPVLVGDRAQIERIAAREGIDLHDCAIEDVPDLDGAAMAAMEMVRAGEVGALMKGKITTPNMMHIGLKNGLRREGRVLSHLAAFDSPRLGRLLIVTDSGIIPYPNLEQRVQIIRNAVEAMRSLGTPDPLVAVLAATEDVSERIPISMDAARLKEMNAPGGELEGCGVIDGPMDFFAAVDPEAAKVKGIGGEVAGRADILHCPDVVSGNLMGKAATFFPGEIRTGGCVVGGAVPIVLLSRASSADDKYCSILLALSC